MTDTPKPVQGSLVWTDLTVADATGVRDFYQSVVGWSHKGLDMGGYEDYCMNAADGSTVAGICHARGGNADQPAQWMVYISVPDLDASLAAVTQGGGRVVVGPKAQGNSRYAVIEDPAGAVCGLYQT